MISTLEDFRTAMRLSGIDYAGPITADGKLHRVKARGDRDKNSWYVLHSGVPMAGAFGCWKRGINEPWCGAKNGSLSNVQWEEVRAKWKQAEERRQLEDQTMQAKARGAAGWIMQRSPPASDSHPYLELVPKGRKLNTDGGSIAGASGQDGPKSARCWRTGCYSASRGRFWGGPPASARRLDLRTNQVEFSAIEQLPLNSLPRLDADRGG
jgi:hypothetical protein